jgi:hypothetical protein
MRDRRKAYRSAVRRTDSASLGPILGCARPSLAGIFFVPLATVADATQQGKNLYKP